MMRHWQLWRKEEQETEASNVWKAHEIEGSETKPQEKGMKKELF